MITLLTLAIMADLLIAKVVLRGLGMIVTAAMTVSIFAISFFVLVMTLSVL